MNLIHEDIKEYILHYSDVHDKVVSTMITNEIVPSEADAKRLLDFIDVLFKYSTQDMEEGKIIFGELASTADAEKASMMILRVLRANNFGKLVDSWVRSI